MKNADIRQLELLCALIETQSLGEAAARMGVTPSAASQSLSRLRAAFSEDVYLRQGNAWRLTPQGERIIGGLRTVVRLWHEAMQSTQAFSPAECDLRFTLSCTAHSALPDLVHLFSRMRALAPRARLDVQVPLHNAVDLYALRAGRLDVLCASAAPPADARDMHHELLCTVALSHVLLSRNHPRIGDGLTLAQYLAEQHLVTHYPKRDPGMVSPLDVALQARGLPVRRASYVQSLWVCLQLAANTDFLMTVSAEGARVLTGHVPALRSLPLPQDMPAASSRVHMIWHERTDRSRAHRWLRGQLREAARGAPSDGAALT